MLVRRSDHEKSCNRLRNGELHCQGSPSNITAGACDEPIRDRSQVCATMSIALLVLSGVVVTQRLAYKYWAKADYGLDDAFTLLAFLAIIPSTVIVHGMLKNGMGRDVWTVDFESLYSFGRHFYIVGPIYYSQVALLKLALLFFYLRIFSSVGVRQLLWGTVLLVSLYGIAFLVVGLLPCSPISYYWEKWDGEHKGACIDINAAIRANSAISVALDICMLAIPLWQLDKLRLNKRKKAGVALMFCLGTFVTVASAIRLWVSIRFRNETPNATWDLVDLVLLSDIEINSGIVCVCLPSLRLLFRRLSPHLMGTNNERTAKRSSPRTTREEEPCSFHAANGTSATSAMSKGDWSQQPEEIDPNKIKCETTYTVEYSAQGTMRSNGCNV
ncbi:hypothetical protein QQS21_000428 [Conoideocrella luteorostrata]|uniref:Rhodopsin domain-containing protein n=1 Tax=Conoideocrella luteorostrata TaxID=1105319 RepID=A0AAJ0D188_9HYPO|nr:hypothetical protein QQS21_000428 [Conoideocrella luteorostrata]